MSNNTIYQTPPPAYGRPPLGNNSRAEQPNGDHSADHGALGNAMLNGDMSDDDDDEDPFGDDHSAPIQRQQPIPLAAPKPGYAAPVAALNLASPTTPSPSASPVGRQPSPSQGPRPLMLVNNLNGVGSAPNSPRMPSPGISVPSTPHPLPPTITPIQPAFVRPNKVAEDRDIKFAPSTPILRGEKEETLLPRRGERGDDFWRRFSMVVKQERLLPQAQKESAWLRKTQNGSTRLSRWVWIVGLALLIVIIGAVALGVYVSSKNQSHNAPTAFGGSANEGLETSSSDTVHASITNGGGIEHSSSRHVSPTATVARRDEDVAPAATGYPGFPGSPRVYERSSFENFNVVRAIPPSRHRRVHHNRSET